MKKEQEKLKVTQPPETSAGRHAISEDLKDVFSKAGVVSNLASATLAFAAFLLCSVGFPAGRVPAAYLIGLMGILGSSTIMLETMRKRGSRWPLPSKSGKYFWFCRMVRIRHSAGTSRKARSKPPP